MKNEYKKLELEQLILMAKKGNKNALEELILREEKSIFSTLHYLKADNEDISDISQEILVKLAKNIGKLKNPLTFKSWLKQIILHQFYDNLRKKRRCLQTIDIDNECKNAYQVPDYSTNPYIKAQGKELDKIIKLAIGKLPIDFKKAIIMRELRGLSYEEIADKTNSNIGTVKSRLSRARNKLQNYIEPYIREN